MNNLILTETTTHRGVTNTKLCTMIEGKKFCEVKETTAAEAGSIILGLFGAMVMWAVLAVITYKSITRIFGLGELDDWALPAAIFSFFAPLGYLGLFLVVFN